MHYAITTQYSTGARFAIVQHPLYGHLPYIIAQLSIVSVLVADSMVLSIRYIAQCTTSYYTVLLHYMA